MENEVSFDLSKFHLVAPELAEPLFVAWKPMPAYSWKTPVKSLKVKICI